MFRQLDLLRFSSVTGQPPGPHTRTWTCKRTGSAGSRFCFSFPLSRPTSSLLHLAAHLSGTLDYFGSAAPAKNRPKLVEHIRSRGPLGDSRRSDPSAASERASVGFSVNRCSSLFSLSFQSDLKTSFTEHSVARSFPSGLFVHLLSQGEKKVALLKEPLKFHLLPHWKHQAPKNK